ncbi:hypothetical protein BGZ83_005364 [Gryganskiella cystojenkinii]|nr:hypothetical protein BGZ83_005364 [Gryganskiella cystojenkinii]
MDAESGILLVLKQMQLEIALDGNVVDWWLSKASVVRVECNLERGEGLLWFSGGGVVILNERSGVCSPKSKFHAVDEQ